MILIGCTLVCDSRHSKLVIKLLGETKAKEIFKELNPVSPPPLPSPRKVCSEQGYLPTRFRDDLLGGSRDKDPRVQAIV